MQIDIYGNIEEVEKPREPEEIIRAAIDKHDPVYAMVLVSGGYDSITNAHVSIPILKKLGLDFVIYHGDTTIGIKETRQYVVDFCKANKWQLEIRKPPNRRDWYDETVKKFGFPGPTKFAHQIMFRRLKERAIKHFVTHEVKSKPYSRENVLLLSGVRKSESAIRMGYADAEIKDDSRIWCNPIFWWNDAQVLSYRKEKDIPVNMVKERLCISGECLCGSFANNGEYEEINRWYPEAGNQIYALWKEAKKAGHPWFWSEGPKSWQKNNPDGQGQLFMCVGCEERRQNQIAP